MEMVDSDPSHFSAAVCDSDSVPPGLGSHDNLSHGSSALSNGASNGGSDSHPPPAVSDENAPTAPPSSEAEVYSPAHSAATEPVADLVIPSTTTDADRSSSAQAHANEQSSSSETAFLDASLSELDQQELHDLPVAGVNKQQHEHPDFALPVEEPTQLLEPPPDVQDFEHLPSSPITLNASPLPPVGSVDKSSPHIKFDADNGHVPSANRLSISFAAGSRRMVIDSGVVEKLKVFRSDARIEVYINITEENSHLKGILVNASSPSCMHCTKLGSGGGYL